MTVGVLYYRVFGDKDMHKIVVPFPRYIKNVTTWVILVALKILGWATWPVAKAHLKLNELSTSLKNKMCKV